MSQSAVPDTQMRQTELYRHNVVKKQSKVGHDPSMTKIAYLMKTYPRLSETFILNEILGLEDLGAHLHIFSLRRPDENTLHPAVEKVDASVTYTLELTGMRSVWNWIVLLKLHLQLITSQPVAYVGTVLNYLRQPGKQRLKEVIHAGYLAHEVRKSGCTHIHAHFANVPTTVAELIHGFTDIPFSFTAHAKDIYLSSPAELDRKIGKAEFVLTCTDYNRTYLTALSTSDTAIHCVYHGIDLSLFNGRQNNHEIAVPADGVPLILSVGRYCEKKGFPYLIRACKMLQDRGVSFRCVIVGYGPLREELNALIVELGVEASVSLAEKMTQDRVAEMYRSAAVFALPCLVTDDGDRDGIPNVLIEAMAQQLPVVSTNVSAISELVEPMENGLLVPEKNAYALAEALDVLLSEPELRQTMGENGRKRVIRNFSRASSASNVWARFHAATRACTATRSVTQDD